MSDGSVKVLLYSDDRTVRKAVIEGVGFKPAKDLPPVEWVEAATAAGAYEAYAAEQPQVIVVDAESYKVGGMAVLRQLEDRQDASGPAVVLTARPQDKWLATWAGATEIVPRPLDPFVLQRALSRAIRAI